MKAIFPCSGSLIMSKSDIEKIINFYTSNKVKNLENSSVITQSHSFNYFNDNSTIILNNVTPLTVSGLKKILGISSNTIENKSSIKNNEFPIDDNSILSNSFFTTLSSTN